MKHLRLFENFSEIKVSEADKIKSIPGFDFSRTKTILGYQISGRRSYFPMEYITISKDGDLFHLHIRRAPGFFKDLTTAGQEGWEEDWNREDRVWTFDEKFEDIESLRNYLLNFEWYDSMNDKSE